MSLTPSKSSTAKHKSKKVDQQQRVVGNEVTKVGGSVVASVQLRKEILAQMKSVQEGTKTKGTQPINQKKAKVVQEKLPSPRTPRRTKKTGKQITSQSDGTVPDMCPTSSLASLPPISRLLPRDWTEVEQRRLYAAVGSGNPAQADFWRKVASSVGSGRSAAECQTRYASIVSTPPAPKRSKARTRSPEDLPSGKKAPMKRKKVLRRLMEARVKQEVADDGFDDAAGEYDFSSIHSAKKLKKSLARASSSTTTETGETEHFGSVDREKLDSYLGKIKKNAKKSAKSRPDPTLPAPTTGTTVSAFLDMAKCETVDDEGDEGDEGDEED